MTRFRTYWSRDRDSSSRGISANYKRDQSQVGVRTDFNTWSKSMSNPLTQLPPYTALGNSSNTGVFLNRDNLKYIQSDHLVAGIELIPTENIQLTMEGFYRNYSKYPFSGRDQVPLSSKSAGYGIFGDEELTSVSDGKAYGIELLGRLKEFTDFYYIHDIFNLSLVNRLIHNCPVDCRFDNCKSKVDQALIFF